MDEHEKTELASLNLTAGRKARASIAYRAGRRYYIAGMDILPEDSWKDQYQLTFSLYKERSESEYLCGEFDKAEEYFIKTLQNSRTRLEQAEIFNVRMVLYTTMGQYALAIMMAIEGLKLFDLELPQNPEQKTILAELLKSKWNLGFRGIPKLIGSAELKDAEKKSLMSLFMNLCAPTYLENQDLFTLVVLKMVNISLKYGHADVSSYAYMAYGVVLGSGLGDYKGGQEFGKLALALSEKFNTTELKCKLLLVFGVFINVWREPLENNLPHLHTALASGQESGDMLYAGYAMVNIILTKFMKGDSLAEVDQETFRGLDFFRRSKDENMHTLVNLVRHMCMHLKGTLENDFSFQDETFDEEMFLMLSRENYILLCWYHLFKLQAFFLSGHLKRALSEAEAADKIMEIGHLGQFSVAEHLFYYSLTLCALYETASGEERKSYRKIMRRNEKRMRKWDRNCPGNFRHKHLLMRAEERRMLKKKSKARELYRQSVETARINKFNQDLALANELAARFLLSEGDEANAKSHMQSALRQYRQWGADRKVTALEKEHPDWKQEP